MDKIKSHLIFAILILAFLGGAIYFSSFLSNPTYSEDINTTRILQLNEEMKNYRITVDKSSQYPKAHGEDISQGEVLKQHYREYELNLASAMRNLSTTAPTNLPAETVRIRIVVFKNTEIAKQQAQAFLESKPQNSTVTTIKLADGRQAKRVRAVVDSYKKIFIISERIDNLHFYVSTKTSKAAKYTNDDKAVAIARKLYKRMK